MCDPAELDLVVVDFSIVRLYGLPGWMLRWYSGLYLCTDIGVVLGIWVITTKVM